MAAFSGNFFCGNTNGATSVVSHSGNSQRQPQREVSRSAAACNFPSGKLSGEPHCSTRSGKLSGEPHSGNLSGEPQRGSMQFLSGNLIGTATVEAASGNLSGEPQCSSMYWLMHFVAET